MVLIKLCAICGDQTLRGLKIFDRYWEAVKDSRGSPILKLRLCSPSVVKRSLIATPYNCVQLGI